MSPNAWRTVVDIVLNGTFLCCRDLARRLIPADRDGAIVNVGASYAWTGGPGFAHSAAAKAGVKNLTETLAVEWAPYGIRVNGLVPGLMPHEDETAAIAAVPGKYEGQDSRVPAGRVGFPRELAWAATYLCSPVRHLHQRPLPGGGRGQLAATPHRATALHPDPRAARPPAVRPNRPRFSRRMVLPEVILLLRRQQASPARAPDRAERHPPSSAFPWSSSPLLRLPAPGRERGRANPGDDRRGGPNHRTGPLDGTEAGQ